MQMLHLFFKRKIHEIRKTSQYSTYYFKVFEKLKLIKNQINLQIKSFLLPYLCIYRSAMNVMMGYGGAVLIDLHLHKAFDNLNDDLLIVKFHAYGVHIKTLKLLHG